MRNISNVVKKSKNIICKDRSTWIPLYYSFANDAVYTSEGDGRMLVTKLINPNEAADIIEAVERWKRM